MIKENANQPHTSSTQSETSVSQRLEGVRKAARENKEAKFTALLHHMTVDLLRESFYALKSVKRLPGWTGLRGRTMRQAWKIDLSTFTAGSIAEPTGHSPRGECSFRKVMGGNAH
jgi:predicted ATPase